MRQKHLIFGLAALCSGAFGQAIPANAQADNSALLDALVKKGVLSDGEAKDIQATDERENNTTAAAKISLPSSVKSITFYGDLRLRYEQRTGSFPSGNPTSTTAFTHGDSEDLSRWRYRLRLGIKGTLYDNFFFGIRAATNPFYNRSGNVTFGSSDSAGPFGKARSVPAIDQVYLGWHATDDLTFTGGQMPNPFYATSMIWAEDINPTGAAEQFDHTFGNGFEVFGTAGQFVYQASNGNGIVNGIGTGSAASFATTFMYGEQVGFKYNFSKDTFYKGAFTAYTYSGTRGNNAASVGALYSDTPFNLSNTGANTTSGAVGVGAQENNSPSFFNGPFVGAADAPISNVSGINDLAVLDVPMEFDFKVGPGIHSSAPTDPKDTQDMKDPVIESTTGWAVPMRFFADVAYNLEGSERADAARNAIEGIEGNASVGNVGVTAPGTLAGNRALVASPTFQGVLTSGKALQDQLAYQVGVEAGQLKKKGDWDGKLFWQSTGYYAVDPNLIDADIFNAATNMQGVVVAASHNWTDGLSSTLRYARGSPVNTKLATPNVNQDLQIGDIHQYNLFQADVMWKF